MIEKMVDYKIIVRFGYGDIGQCDFLMKIDDEYNACMAYFQLDTPQQIGSPTKQDGSRCQIVSGAPVLFAFKNIESIDVVIENLRVLRKHFNEFLVEMGSDD